MSDGEWLPVLPAGIAAELRSLSQWVLWAHEARSEGEQPTKIPYCPATLRRAKANDPATWGTFDTALSTYSAGRRRWAGVGFEFATDGGLVGVDLDDCRNRNTGELASWAVEIIERFNTYAEISPSGTGVKLWAKGRVPGDGTGKKRPYQTGAVEMYGRGRFFAMTGHRLESAPATVNEAQAAIDWFHALAFATPKGPERNGHHRAADDDLGGLIGRARKYIATMPPAIDGQGGHDQTFAVACALVVGFALTPDQAFPLLLQYNEICQPPWSEKELWHKLHSANQQPGDRGKLRDAQRNDYRPKAGDNGAPAATPAERIEYQLVTCRELDTATYDLEYLIDGILVARQPCIVAGGKKTLKTSMLIALGLSLATAEPFLGQFKVHRSARVLLMTGESGLATIQETTRRIAAAHGLALADVGGLIFSPQLPLFGHLNHLDALVETLKANEIEALVIDPAYLCMQTDGNEASLFAMGALLRGMTNVCQQAGATFILAHHTRKTLTDPFAPPELEDISWAGFNEFARQWVLIGRRERYQPGSGEHRLWLNAGGSAGHSSCWALDIAEGVYDGRTPRQWQVGLMRADEARQEAERRQEAAKDEKRKASSAAQLEADRKAVVAVMVKMPERTGTKTEIKERSHLSTPRVSTAIASLADDGTIVECETTKGNNRPYPAWKLKGDTDE